MTDTSNNLIPERTFVRIKTSGATCYEIDISKIKEIYVATCEEGYCVCLDVTKSRTILFEGNLDECYRFLQKFHSLLNIKVIDFK